MGCPFRGLREDQCAHRDTDPPIQPFAVLGGSSRQEWVKRWHSRSHQNHTTMNDSVLDSESESLLDNPIWNSLATQHAHLAIGADIGHGLARRYPSDISPLSAVQELTPEAYADLAAIVPEGDVAVLFLENSVEIPAGWQLLRDGTLVQMICPAVPGQPSFAETILPMTAADFPEMVDLAKLTEPGPFREHTANLGGFVGIRVDGHLAAMAGQRLAPTGFAEVSAVCTHPDFRGRGFAQTLVASVTRNIHSEGRTPFLTSFEANTGAIRIYHQVGFVHRRTFQLAVLKPPSPPHRHHEGGKLLIRRRVLWERRGLTNYDETHADEYKVANHPLLLKLDGRAINTARLDDFGNGAGAVRIVAIEPDLQRQGH
jgi:GNAT superfamily N-acetyltransferase